jgi:hypothetical protein
MAAYEKARPAPRAAAADTVLKRLKDTDTNTARAFARIDQHLTPDKYGNRPNLIALLVNCLDTKTTSAQTELKCQMDWNIADAAKKSLPAIKTFVKRFYLYPERDDVFELVKELSRDIYGQLAINEAHIDILDLSDRRDLDFAANAALRALLWELEPYAYKGINPDVSTLAEAVLGIDKSDNAINKLRLRFKGRERHIPYDGEDIPF